LRNETDPVPTILSKYTYQQDKSHVQTFEVSNKSLNPFPLVVLEVVSNYGHPEYTCVYRFRVHGKPTSSPQRQI